MNRKLTSLALASLGMLALALPTASHAAVMATSVVNVTSFTLTDASLGGAQLDFVTDFGGALTFTSSAGYAGSLGGASFSDSSSAAPINFLTACVGSGCVAGAPAGPIGDAPIGYGADNSYTKLTAPPVAGNWAAADQANPARPSPTSLALLAALSRPWDKPAMLR